MSKEDDNRVSDSDRPLEKMMQSRNKALLGSKQDKLGEELIRIQNVRKPRSHGRRFFGGSDPKKNISIGPPPSITGRKKRGRPPRIKRA